jgi:hypothetical protein
MYDQTQPVTNLPGGCRMSSLALAPYKRYIISLPRTKPDPMKKLLFLLMIPVAAAFVSCGGEKKEETAKIPGMMEVDLSPYGIQATMMIPDSTKGIADIQAQSYGVEIKVGKSYQILVKEGDEDIELKKSDIKSNEVFKLKRYVKEEPTLLFYEVALPDAEQGQYHFFAIVKAGNSTYIVEDIQEEAFTEKDIERMVESAKSIKPKEAPAAS